jgi:hypothetical protein
MIKVQLKQSGHQATFENGEWRCDEAPSFEKLLEQAFEIWEESGVGEHCSPEEAAVLGTLMEMDLSFTILENTNTNESKPGRIY